MTTVKIHSTHPASQGPFVVIDKADFNPDVHELYDDGTDQGVAVGERLPTIAELRAAAESLQARERELNAERDRVADQARANEVEAQRLAGEKASAEKLARETAAAAEVASKAAAEKAAAKAAAGDAAKK